MLVNRSLGDIRAFVIAIDQLPGLLSFAAVLQSNIWGYRANIRAIEQCPRRIVVVLSIAEC